MPGARILSSRRGAALACAGVRVFASCGGGSDEPTDAKPVAVAETAQVFAQPPRVTAVDGVLHLDLVANDRNIHVAGTPVKGQAYGNDIEGPTFVVSPGDTMDITLDDRLTAHTNLHFHGLHVSLSENEKNQFFINGKEFDPNRVDVHAKLGTAEEWTLENTSDEQHPFHIHVNDFEVVSIGGKPYAAKGLQDTVPLLPGKDVVVRMRFLDFTGKYVFHCRILNREDNGMMGVVEVSR